MKKNQRTSEVSDGQAKLLGRMTKDAAKKYQGGLEKAELVKGHPDFVKRTYELWDNLAAEQAIRLPITERPNWMILQRTCNDAKSYISALESGGCKVGDWTRDIMNKPAFMVGFDIDTVELMSATVKELIGKNLATTVEVFAAIRKVGALCPAWVGSELRKQYMDQPKGEWLVIGMEPIADSLGRFEVFNVTHGSSGLWLNTSDTRPDDHWDGDNRFVFVPRK